MGSATKLAQALAAEGVVGKRGKPIDKGVLYKLLNNRLYIGEAVHKGESYPGEHEAIVDRVLWDKVHASPQAEPEEASRRRSRADAGAAEGSDLRAGRLRNVADAHPAAAEALSLLCQPDRVEAGRRKPARSGACPPPRSRAAVIDQIRILLRSPEIVVATWRAARRKDGAVSEVEVREALHASSIRYGRSCSPPSRRGSFSSSSSGWRSGSIVCRFGCVQKALLTSTTNSPVLPRRGGPRERYRSCFEGCGDDRRLYSHAAAEARGTKAHADRGAVENRAREDQDGRRHPQSARTRPSMEAAP